MFKTFETKRLLLRPTGTQDADIILKKLNMPKFLRYVGDRNVRTLAEAEQYIEARMLPQLHQLGYSSYTLIRKSDGEKLGSAGLYRREGVSGIDLGLGLLPPFERQGFGFECCNRLIEAAFYEFHLEELNAITAKENIASQGLLKKLGFRPAGVITLPDSAVKQELLLFKLGKDSRKALA